MVVLTPNHPFVREWFLHLFFSCAAFIYMILFICTNDVSVRRKNLVLNVTPGRDTISNHLLLGWRGMNKVNDQIVPLFNT